MVTLLQRLDPKGIELKGQIVSGFFENPFLETSPTALVLRFHSDSLAVGDALADLCRCGVLTCEDGHFRLEAHGAVYEEAASLAASYRTEETALREQVVELEALARLRDILAVTQREVGAIPEMVPVGVLLLDRYGHLLKCNALARELVGLDSDGLDQDVCDRLGLDLEIVLAREARCETELVRPLAVVSRPFRVSGSETGAVEDITYRREIAAREEKLREEFFSMIRHELRRLLLTVERFLGGLSGQEVDPHGLGHARSAASHLGEMVNDMLLLARLERDPMAVSLKDWVSLRFLLAGSDLAFRARASEAGVNLRMVPPEEDTLLLGDERRLGQLVGNLLDNAIKFTLTGGEVDLRGDRANGEVWISVTDTGPGIPERLRERVFDKFYQARQDDGWPPGLGLGLAICQRLALAHGGGIEVSEGPQGGTAVTVRIPLPSEPRQ